MAYKPSAPTSSRDPLSKPLFSLAIHAEWDEIVKIYKKDPNAHTTKITKSGDTALHLAVQDGKEVVVEKLVDLIVGYSPNNYVEVLGVKNVRGDTPLHFAASLGNLPMCLKLASSSHELIGIRNNEGETPLFVAAANGKKEAFLCLHILIPDTRKAPRAETGMSYGRKTNDGDTVLHCALDGDYFDLAFQIIHLYGELGNRLNVDGNSPLHLLANKPSAFKSGSRLGFIDKIMYHCTFVNRLKVENLEGICKCLTPPTKKERSTTYPENYLVCVHFYDFFRELFESLGRWRSTAAGRETDTESQVPVPQTNQAAVPVPPMTQTNQAAVPAPQTKKDAVPAPRTNQVLSPNQVLPPNYDVIFDFLKLFSKAMFIILGLGHRKIEKIKEKKEKHIWSVQIMDELLKVSLEYQYEQDGQESVNVHSNEDGSTAPYDFNPEALLLDRSSSDASQSVLDAGEPTSNAPSQSKETAVDANGKKKKHLEVFPVAISDKEIDRNKILLLAVDEEEVTKSTKSNSNKGETPILTAAKNGITEMVENIYKKFPLAINDLNEQKKNVVLLAVENRQPDVYELLQNLLKDNDGAFRKVDIEGNSALHLAARLAGHRPWLIPGAALQMQWELKWYEFVKDSKPPHFFPKYNKKRTTPRDVLSETHKDLVKEGGEWLTHTSESCSLVAALIATVAFATSSTVPGGVDQSKGTPTLEKQPAFDVFAIAALVALGLSVTSLVMFLSILTSRYQEKDFRRSLPRKLLVGLTSLFLAIVAMMISFCAGHFFVLKDNLKYGAIFVYAVTCLPITIFFAVAQFPLYFDLLWAAAKKVPQRGFQVVTS